ncbi:MAG: flagellar hook protein FlgE [Candidatus Devosia phytovorans]|uniref:Flagellar hook protein FlgE n=1 Tax=Candidatus Devosia phytovorans TaxID=3121372 RepID=A0AAJ6AZ06_9HYPH|nr:flagellar hook protein FlgE [Devosia sp.]WEK03291.1 MAG: flagellar hook protein FlgE [Devosia sp.]
MSLSAAISSAVSGLNAQSAALASVSNNLANSSTVGYKSGDTSFASLVTGTATKTTSTGGVISSARSNVDLQGLLTTSTVSTNMAISGNGMFVVAGDSNSSDLLYTRNGEFTVDSEGYLVNNGYYLQGWKTDASGNVIGGTSASSLSAIDTDGIASVAAATTTSSMTANLPAEAEVGATFTSSLELYDSLGTAATTTVTWTKTAENTWSIAFSDPTLSSDPTQAIGSVTSSDITVNFNDDGTLASTSPATPSLTIAGWTTGAATSAVTLNLGEAGSASGLSQYSSSASTPTVSVTSTQDGMRYGSLSGIDIGDDGTVFASYSNGTQIAVYKVAVATFSNTNGLTAQSGGLYSANNASGSATFKLSGQDGAGTIFGSQLEASTTDTNSEFSRMMAAQQAYSSAAQAITAANAMFDTLISAVR